MTTNETKLREFAKDHPSLQQMFIAYDKGLYASWDDFVVDALMLSLSINAALHDTLEDLLHNQPTSDNP